MTHILSNRNRKDKKSLLEYLNKAHWIHRDWRQMHIRLNHSDNRHLPILIDKYIQMHSPHFDIHHYLNTDSDHMDRRQVFHNVIEIHGQSSNHQMWKRFEQNLVQFKNSYRPFRLIHMCVNWHILISNNQIWFPYRSLWNSLKSIYNYINTLYPFITFCMI
jgi:hypothetical protein